MPHTARISSAATLLFLAATLSAQTPTAKPADPLSKPFQERSTSSIAYSGGKDGERTVEIANVAYEVTGDSVPLRPAGSRLVLRTTTHSSQVVGDKGVESTVTLEAWPLGADLKQKPLYAVKVPAIEARTLADGLWVVDRSLDGDTSWWSVYQVGTGKHLFDTYVELRPFPLSREIGEMRYAGLEVPPDDAADARLKDPHVVAVLTYASSEKVIRELLITSANPSQARQLRSYADAERTVTLVERPGVRELRIAFEDSYPSPPHPLSVTVPIVKDDLDAAHAQVAAGLRVAAWKR